MMRLRYPGRCDTCAAELAKGTEAWYDATRKKVRCSSCAGSEPPAAAEPVGTAPVIDPGVAGASAQREYNKRSSRRQARIEAEIAADTAWRTEIKQARPVVGRLAAAITAKPSLGPEPQHIKAWTVGADGEQKVGRRLDAWAAEADDRAVLHDRRIPGSRANIDHLAIGPGGVWVIDAKEYAGKIEHVNAGTIFRPAWQLQVGGRNKSKLAAGVQWQMSNVTDVLERLDNPAAWRSVTGMLCFVGADWSWFAKPFALEGVVVAWPLTAVELLSRPADDPVADVPALADLLARAFPPA